MYIENHFCAMFSGNTDKAVIGTFDDAQEGLGPSGKSSVSVAAHSVRFQLPVPCDISDLVSELHAIGRMQTEMEKSVARVLSVVDGSSANPYPRAQTVGSQAIDMKSNHSPDSRIPLKAEASRTVTRQMDRDSIEHEFTPTLPGYTESPQPKIMHFRSNMLLAATYPVTNILESPKPHELSAISHEALGRGNQAGERTNSVLNLSRQDISFENSRIFASPAPSRSVSSARMQHIEVLDDSNPNLCGNLLQRDALQPSQIQLSTSRVSGASGLAQASFPAAFNPDFDSAVLSPAVHQKPIDSARKLQLKMQLMDSKNREIDSLLAKFLMKKTEMNTSSSKGVVEPHESNLLHNLHSGASNPPNVRLTSSPSLVSLASPKKKMGISSMFRERSD